MPKVPQIGLIPFRTYNWPAVSQHLPGPLYEDVLDTPQSLRESYRYNEDDPTISTWNELLRDVLNNFYALPDIRFDNYCEGLGPERMRPDPAMLRAFANYPGERVRIQFGLRYRAVAPIYLSPEGWLGRGPNEYGADPIQVAIMLIGLVKKYGARKLPRMYIDCPGARYSYRADGKFHDCPRFETEPGFIALDWNFEERARARHGLATIEFPNP